MADEEAYAGLTDRIATAMTQTQGTLKSLTDEFDDEHIGRMLDRRLEAVEFLKPGVNSVRAAEQAIENARGAAVEPAKQALVSTYRSYQVDAGNLSSRIGGALRDLDSHRDTLRERADSLKGALRDIETIQQMPGRATDDMAKLRTGVEYLRSVVDVVDGRVEAMMNQLSNAQRSANEFERSGPRIGTNQHSVEIGAAIGSLEGSLSQTRRQVTDLKGELDERSAGFRTVAQFGVDVANKASTESREAAADNAELATAMRVAANPTERIDEQAVANQGESDLSHRLGGAAPQGLQL